jgi:hypothetical protein
MVGLPWAADSCPWVGKLRTVLPFSDVIRDSAVQLVLTHQRARTSGTSDELTVLYSNGLDDKSVTLATWTNPSRWLRDNCHERLLALTPGGEGPALERQKKALTGYWTAPGPCSQRARAPLLRGC